MDPSRRDELYRSALQAASQLLVLAAIGFVGAAAVRVARRGLGILWKHSRAASRFASTG
jgi:hypothetical protein